MTMKTEQKVLYVVVNHDTYFKKPSIGYLPHKVILENQKTKLFKAVFGKEYAELEHHAWGGLLGIYYDKTLAQEHIELEKKFRSNRDKYEIITIK